MQKWEYKFFTISGLKAHAIDERLNQFGAEGWEMVNMSATFGWIAFLMKRPKS